VAVCGGVSQAAAERWGRNNPGLFQCREQDSFLFPSPFFSTVSVGRNGTVGPTVT